MTFSLDQIYRAIASVGKGESGGAEVRDFLSSFTVHPKRH